LVDNEIKKKNPNFQKKTIAPVKLSDMVEILTHRALHSITKHLSGILKCYLTFSQMQCKPLFKHCHSTVY